MIKVMSTKKVSDEVISDLFTEVYQEQVAKMNRIQEFEVTSCTRQPGEEKVTLEVFISGFAGTPILEEYQSGKLDNADEVIIQREDLGSLPFKFAAKDSYILNTNDYVVVYKS